jgi:hypothetical protein
MSEFDIYDESITPTVKEGYVAEKVYDIGGKFVFWKIKKKAKDCGCKSKARVINNR